ncbi:MAG: cupin domain-containing protein [Acidobacteriota bacterium]
MTARLEGGCLVTRLDTTGAVPDGTLRAVPIIGRDTGARAISLRALEFAPGLSPGLRNETCDEVLYVLSGHATVWLDGRPHAIEAETGLYLEPGRCLTLDNPGPDPVVMVSSRCPEPDRHAATCPALTRPDPSSPSPATVPFVRLWDRAPKTTADRWYRLLVDREAGCTQVTQFVGSIPPGRAPDHYHEYEEVLCVLQGEGRMWAGKTTAPVTAGSCIYLPRRQVHCVENTGRAELRLLGVFYPAGSPAVRYDPD